MKPALNILHVNDTEGAPGDVWPRIATAIAQARAAGRCDLLLHAGDVPLETPTAKEGAHAIAHLGFDAVALGNHDLAESDAILQRRLDELMTPMLCANVVGLLPDDIQSYRLLNVQGWNIVIIGITHDDLPRYIVRRRMDGLTVLRSKQVLANLMPRLRRNADLLVVVSHCGYDQDRAIARTVPGIDLIVGGHDHLFLPEPERVHDTWLAQAGADGKYVGCITVQHAGGRLQVTGGHVLTEQLAPDTAMLHFLTQTNVDPADLEIVGYTAVDLRLPRPDAYSPACWHATPLGHLTVDLMRAYAVTDIALLRCSSVINELPAGPIRRHDLRRLNKCSDDQIVCLVVTGRELLSILESGAREGYHLLLTAGARVIYDANQIVGQRVVSVQIGDGVLELDHAYTVACSEILANGVSDYPVVATKPRTALPHTIGQLLAAHIQSEQVIQPALDERLVIHGHL